MGKKKRRHAPPPIVQEKTSFLTDPRILLAAVLLLALLVRLAALASISKSLYGSQLLWDEQLYHTWAEKIADGTFTSSSVYEFSPLFAYMMAFIYKGFSPDIYSIRLLNVALGILTCGLLYLLGKELVNPRAGLVACLIGCLYKPFIFYSVVPMKTGVEICLFALAVYLLLIWFRKQSALWALLSGMSFGLLMSARPNAIILAPVFPAVLIYSWRRGLSFKRMMVTTCVYAAGLLLAVSPFVARNYMVARELVITTSQGGYNLYLGNNIKSPDPYYRPVPFASTVPFLQGIHFTIEASRRTGKKLSPGEASVYWTGEVYRTARENTSAFAAKLGRKALALFNNSGVCDHYHIAFLSDFIGFFKIPFFDFWLVFPLGMAGMAIVFRSPKAFSLSALFWLYALTLIAFFPSDRYRQLLFVILIPLSVAGVLHLRELIRGKKSGRIAIYSLVAAAFSVIEFLPVQGSDDLSAYYNTHAIVLTRSGSTREAVGYWEKSSSMGKPFSAFANLALAAVCYRQDRIADGNSYLDKIPDNSFAASQKYELLGDMRTGQRDMAGAIEAYERSLEINSGDRRTRAKLILLLQSTDRAKAARQEEMLKYISTFYDLM